MKKNLYEAPSLELIKVTEDVITESGNGWFTLKSDDEDYLIK